MTFKDFDGLVEPGSDEAGLLDQLDFERMPHHVAIIMDGNGRWAGKRGMPRIEGHRRGVKAVKEVVETARRLDIKVLTLYAFSTENWKRPKAEVRILFSLLSHYIKSELPSLLKNGIRFATIGHIQDLPKGVQKRIQGAKDATAGQTNMILNVALSYSGHQDIVDAVRNIATDTAAGRLDTDEIDAAMVANYLSTSGLPNPDLLIRTSGEMRISNFLLWQVAYAEIYVTQVLWPDFRRPDLFQAMVDFQARDRRFGGVPSETSRAEKSC